VSHGDVLVEANAELWERLTTHPFVVAVADGSLPKEAFERWLVEDHYFVMGFRRFLARMVEIAPTEAARDLLVAGLAALQPELELFREEAGRRGLDLGHEPAPTNVGYTAFVQASPLDGFPVALTVLYGAERAYFDAWSAARATCDAGSPYWPFVDNWSSEAFGRWVHDIDLLLEATVPDAGDPTIHRAFTRVVRFELRFWDAVHAGERW